MKIFESFLAILISIFSSSANISSAPKLTIIYLAGDVMLGRTVMTTSIDKNDFSYPFQKVKTELSNGDIVFANLENPIVEGCPRHTDGFKFCADPRMVQGLKSANISIVTIANNHTRNYGETGFAETKKILLENNIDYVGDNNLVIKEINGTKFGFIGFDFLTNTPTEKDYLQVSDADSKVDVLIVGVHWGVEYKAVANKFQIEIAQKLSENGADIVAGHHPHWVQNSENIGNSRIYYSLGNFVFDQMWSEETKKGLVVKLTLDGTSIVNEEFLPIYIKERGQPEFVSQ